MPFTFHSHSGEFCFHGAGKLEEVVLRAIELKFVHLGLSEHVPRFRTQDLYPEEEHITTKKLEENFLKYLEEASRLKLKYADQIEIVIGAETENIYPNYLQELTPWLAQPQPHLDYLVGSVHHVDGIPIDFNEEQFKVALNHCGGSYHALYCKYFDAQFAMLQHLKPTVVGHFDLIRLFAPADPHHRELPADGEVWDKVKRNVQFIIEYGGLFEINSRALKKNLPTPYPLEDIASYIFSHGGRFTLSDDSHGPREVGLHYDKIPKYLDNIGIKELWYITKSDSTKAQGNCDMFLSSRVKLAKLDNWKIHPYWTPII